MITSDLTLETETVVSPDAQLHEEITGILDGLGAIKKVKGLTDESRERAGLPLLTALAEAVEQLGEPIARGNTLYFLPPGADKLVVIDLTPKKLIRL